MDTVLGDRQIGVFAPNSQTFQPWLQILGRILGMLTIIQYKIIALIDIVQIHQITTIVGHRPHGIPLVLLGILGSRANQEAGTGLAKAGAPRASTKVHGPQTMITMIQKMVRHNGKHQTTSSVVCHRDLKIQ